MIEIIDSITLRPIRYTKITMDYLSFAICLLLAWAAMHLILSSVKKASQNQSNSIRIPPGSPTLPILGNLLNLSKKAHVSMADLAKTYGPLMTLRLGRVTTVIISSSSVAKEVLQKNDNSFCDRALIDVVRAIDHHKNSLIWLPVTPLWKTLRKLCTTHVFSSAKLDESQSLRREKVQDLISYVENCREDGSLVDVREAAFDTMLNLLSNTFFSVDLVDLNSKLACDFKDTIREIMNEMAKPNLGDYFPILRKIDPLGIRRRATVHFQKMIDLFNTLIEQRLQGERPQPLTQGHDFLDALLGINQEKTSEIETSIIPYLLLDLFTAGMDTTSSALEWAMAELLHNPEKLEKAKAELDEIIGKGNTFEESHIGQLPYLQAVVKETFRLHPAAPLLVLRRADKNVSVFGFTIPKHAQILVNAWAMGRDPDVWETPNSFKPERFMGSGIDVKGCHFELIPFGAGRRICVGLPLATRMIHLMLGSLIRGFDWELEGRVLAKDIDTEENLVFALQMAKPLRVFPVQVKNVGK